METMDQRHHEQESNETGGKMSTTRYEIDEIKMIQARWSYRRGKPIQKCRTETRLESRIITHNAIDIQ